MRLLDQIRARHRGHVWRRDNEPPPPPPPNPNPPPPPPAPPPPPRATGQTDAERIAQLDRMVADTRAEAAANRVEARSAREAQAAAQTELATLRTQADDRVRQTQEAGNVELQATRARLIDAELKAAAVSAGLVDVDLLPLIPRGAIKFGPDGAIQGIVEALADFKGKKPDYFRAQQAPPPPPPRQTGSPNPPPNPNPNPPLTSVATLAPKDYREAKAGALRALRGKG